MCPTLHTGMTRLFVGMGERERERVVGHFATSHRARERCFLTTTRPVRARNGTMSLSFLEASLFFRGLQCSKSKVRNLSARLCQPRTVRSAWYPYVAGRVCVCVCVCVDGPRYRTLIDKIVELLRPETWGQGCNRSQIFKDSFGTEITHKRIASVVCDCVSVCVW